MKTGVLSEDHVNKLTVDTDETDEVDEEENVEEIIDSDAESDIVFYDDQDSDGNEEGIDSDSNYCASDLLTQTNLHADLSDSMEMDVSGPAGGICETAEFTKQDSDSDEQSKSSPTCSEKTYKKIIYLKHPGKVFILDKDQ